MRRGRSSCGVATGKSARHRRMEPRRTRPSRQLLQIRAEFASVRLRDLGQGGQRVAVATDEDLHRLAHLLGEHFGELRLSLAGVSRRVAAAAPRRLRPLVSRARDPAGFGALAPAGRAHLPRTTGRGLTRTRRRSRVRRSAAATAAHSRSGRGGRCLRAASRAPGSRLGGPARLPAADRHLRKIGNLAPYPSGPQLTGLHRLAVDRAPSTARRDVCVPRVQVPVEASSPQISSSPKTIEGLRWLPACQHWSLTNAVVIALGLKLACPASKWTSSSKSFV